MLIPILIAVGFYQLAKRRGLIPFVWAILSIGGYYGFQVLAVYGLVHTNTSIVTTQAGAIGVAIGGGIVGIIVVWIILERVAKANGTKKLPVADDELLDDKLIE